MKRTYILLGLSLAVVIGGSTVWKLYAEQESAQMSDEDLGIVSEYNARDEFSNTQNPNGVWSYGYSTSDADKTLNLFFEPFAPKNYDI